MTPHSLRSASLFLLSSSNCTSETTGCLPRMEHLCVFDKICVLKCPELFLHYVLEFRRAVPKPNGLFVVRWQVPERLMVSSSLKEVPRAEERDSKVFMS